eukprot:CAMPEP_0194035446 /NCGR_PEP_ID=MMETSP0009_2-20130614/7872_1 /TAXON_ID=210454 /ORGANISM="Grammatophora oceanica, Strain CCMP 410" /LENGTH=274 /DNA_ID=CAMNT_0038676801 /DNA_START=156 /DNA_END=980 /DNA_ORIENTATION=+
MSLTPKHRESEITTTAFQDAMTTAVMIGIPSIGAVLLASRSPKFMKITNASSRTALAIMPPMFSFAFTGEMKMQHRMHEVAQETEHAKASAAWAEKRLLETSKQTLSQKETEAQLTDLYKQSVQESGVRIVPGDSLSVGHKMANFCYENPLKVLAGVGIPSFAYIFYGQGGQQSLQMQLLHTRVMGQFSVILGLLSIMGFKAWMDVNGKYITEFEADMRVEEMRRMREGLVARLELGKKEREAQKTLLEEAHIRDVAAGVDTSKKHSVAAIDSI